MNTRLLWLVAAVCALLFRFNSTPPPAPPLVRDQIVALVGQNQRAYQACLDNLRHQNTPGYRSRKVLAALSSGGSTFMLRQNQGPISETRAPYDLAIDGSGFFLLSDGSLTRDGQWMLRDERLWLISRPELCLMGQDGQPVTIGANLCDINIYGDGRVTGLDLNGDGKPQTIAQIGLVRVAYPEAMKYQHPCLLPTPESGPVSRPATPGTNALGVLAQGYLEMANVDPLEQMELAWALRRYAGLLGDPTLGTAIPQPSFAAEPAR
jgi:flagellar hook protein FlgE